MDVTHVFLLIRADRIERGGEFSFFGYAATPSPQPSPKGRGSLLQWLGTLCRSVNWARERQQERHHSQIHYGSTQPTQFLPTLSSREPFRRRDGEVRAVLKSLQLGNEIESSGHNRQRVESHGYSDQPAPRAYFPIQRKRDNQRQDQQRVNQSP